MKRQIANRESAKRVRHRKQQDLDALAAEVWCVRRAVSAIHALPWRGMQNASAEASVEDQLSSNVDAEKAGIACERV